MCFQCSSVNDIFAYEKCKFFCAQTLSTFYMMSEIFKFEIFGLMHMFIWHWSSRCYIHQNGEKALCKLLQNDRLSGTKLGAQTHWFYVELLHKDVFANVEANGQNLVSTHWKQTLEDLIYFLCSSNMLETPHSSQQDNLNGRFKHTFSQYSHWQMQLAWKNVAWFLSCSVVSLICYSFFFLSNS